MIYLNGGSAGDGLERKRNRAQRGGEFLIRQSGDEEASVEVPDVGDRFEARIVLAIALSNHRVGGRIEQIGAREFHLVERNDFWLAVGLNANKRGNGVGAAAARHGQICAVGNRVDRQVIDQNLISGRTQQGGDLLIDRFDLELFGVRG